MRGSACLRILGSVLIFLLPVTTPLFSQTIVINEFLASNSNTNFDEDGDSSDWIELFHTGGASVNLSSYTVTDSEIDPGQWTLPSVTMQAGDYLLIWASGKDRTSGELHANFKLSANGEFVGLYDPDGDLEDGFDFGTQTPDIAMARIPNGIGGFQITAQPTPEAENAGQSPPTGALTFSPASTFFSGSISLTLSSSVGGTIRYTTNGSAVKSSSTKYSSAINVTSTKVIRARVFDGSTPKSEDVSHIYIEDYAGHLAVLSLATDENNLYGSSGIFDNAKKRGDSWERPVSVNLLELDGSGFQINSGLRIHGQHSRTYPKKSMRLYFRGDYGATKLRYRVFDSKKLNEFDRLVVHSGGSFDQYLENPKWTLLRDPLNARLLAEQGGNISVARPVILYINGDLWGIYHLRERLDDNYIRDNFDIADADLLEWNHNETPNIKEGDLNEWNDTWAFLKNNSFKSDSKYQQAKSMVNMDNIIDYNIINIYGGHKDWPHNNVFFFRERVNDARWEWILWDSESTYKNPSIKSLEWATRDVVRTDISSGDSESQLFGTILLRRLMENDDFKKAFINRFADFLNTTLHQDHVREVFDEMAAEIEPDIPLEATRWGVPTAQWAAGLQQVRDFIAARTNIEWNRLNSFFGLSGTADLTVDVNDAAGGKLRVNRLKLKNFPWTGEYFKNCPVPLEAVPEPGYIFKQWSGASSSSNAEIEISLSGNMSVTALFEQEDPPANCQHDGDIDDDGQLTPGDALCAMNIFLNGQSVASDCDEPNFECEVIAADVNCSDEVTPGDALAIFLRFLGNESPADCFNRGAVTPQSQQVEPYQLDLGPGLISALDDAALLRIPLALNRTDGLNAFGLTLAYPADEIEFVKVEKSAATAEWMRLEARATKTGELVLGGFTNKALFSDSPTDLIYLHFRIKGGQRPDLRFEISGLTDDISNATVATTTISLAAASSQPFSFELQQNYPNPFNPETRIRFELPQANAETIRTRLDIHNVTGQLVRTLLDEALRPGAHEIDWDGKNDSGIAVPSGLYFYSLSAGELRASQSMVLVR